LIHSHCNADLAAWHRVLDLQPDSGCPGVRVTAILGITLGTRITAGHSNSSAASERQVDRDVGALLAGIPREGNTLGRPAAPVTLQVFGDLECYDARHWFVKYLPAIIQEFVRPGIVKIQFRSFKTDTHNPTTFINQQSAALAAGTQNKLWSFIETFYHEQGQEYTPYATESYLNNIARQVPGLNRSRWHAERVTGRLSSRVVSDDRTARTLGFHDTPAFRIGRTGVPLKNFSGREIILYAGQKNPVSLVDAQDVRTATRELG
jgi:protein-disulfide isomerase